MTMPARILWWSRVAWGCYVTYYVFSGGPIVASLGRMDRFSAWTLIVLFGWTPMLLPPSLPKVAKLAWGWAASIYLPNVLNAIYFSTGFMWPKTLYWPLALIVAWGPAVIPWLLETRRNWAFASGQSALRDKSGRKADWTFSAEGLQIAVDLARKEFRLRAQSARWKTGGGEWSVGPVEMTRPLLECSLACDAIMVDVHHHVTAQVTGVTAGGTLVNGSVLTGETHTTEEPTGKYRLSVEHRKVEWEFHGMPVRRKADNSISNLGTIHKKVAFAGGPELAVEILDLPEKVGSRLRGAWHDAKRMIEELQKTFEADLLAKRKAEAEDAFLRDESAARERWALAKESANRQLGDLRSKATVGDEFLDMNYGQDGVVHWALAADREGRAAIMDEVERWSGSLAEARATATVEVAQKGSANNADTLELVVELNDPEFERDRLAKRRFRIMRGSSRDTLLAWADRIQILAGQASQPSEAAS